MANHSSVRKQIHDRDTFHAFMAKGVKFGDWDMPVIEPEQRVPTKLVPFSVAVSKSCKGHKGFVHFCEDDGDFERFWKNPRKYLPRLICVSSTVFEQKEQLFLSRVRTRRAHRF